MTDSIHPFPRRVPVGRAVLLATAAIGITAQAGWLAHNEGVLE